MGLKIFSAIPLALIFLAILSFNANAGCTLTADPSDFTGPQDVKLTAQFENVNYDGTAAFDCGNGVYQTADLSGGTAVATCNYPPVPQTTVYNVKAKFCDIECSSTATNHFGKSYVTLSCPTYVVTTGTTKITAQVYVDGEPKCDPEMQLKVKPPNAEDWITYADSSCSNTASGPNVFEIDSNLDGHYELKAISSLLPGEAACAFTALHTRMVSLPDLNVVLVTLVALLALFFLARAKKIKRKKTFAFLALLALTPTAFYATSAFSSQALASEKSVGSTAGSTAGSMLEFQEWPPTWPCYDCTGLPPGADCNAPDGCVGTCSADGETCDPVSDCKCEVIMNPSNLPNGGQSEATINYFSMIPVPNAALQCKQGDLKTPSCTPSPNPSAVDGECKTSCDYPGTSATYTVTAWAGKDEQNYKQCTPGTLVVSPTTQPPLTVSLISPTPANKTVLAQNSIFTVKASVSLQPDTCTLYYKNVSQTNPQLLSKTMTVSQDQTCSVQVSDFYYGAFDYWVNATKIDGSTVEASSEQRRIGLAGAFTADFPPFLTARRWGNWAHFKQNCNYYQDHGYYAWYGDVEPNVAEVKAHGGVPPYSYRIEAHNANFFEINTNGIIKLTQKGVGKNLETINNPFTTQNRLNVSVTDFMGQMLSREIPVVLIAHIEYNLYDGTGWHSGDTSGSTFSCVPNQQIGFRISGWNLGLVCNVRLVQRGIAGPDVPRTIVESSTSGNKIVLQGLLDCTDSDWWSCNSQYSFVSIGGGPNALQIRDPNANNVCVGPDDNPAAGYYMLFEIRVKRS